MNLLVGWELYVDKVGEFDFADAFAPAPIVCVAPWVVAEVPIALGYATAPVVALAHEGGLVGAKVVAALFALA
jgi:hypothetical protein